jgi:hypothetical protein
LFVISDFDIRILAEQNILFSPMVGVAQLVEHRVVAPVVVGSSPITHPIFNENGCFIFGSSFSSHLFFI